MYHNFNKYVYRTATKTCIPSLVQYVESFSPNKVAVSKQVQSKDLKKVPL